MARAAGNTMKVDVALPMEMFETISRIARESNAPIHHRSGEPVVSPTIIRLIGLGILSATDNPEMMTADISRTVADPRVDILSDRVRALEDRLSDEVRSIAESVVEQGIEPIQSDLAELLLRVDQLESSPTSSKPKATTTTEADSEVLKLAKRLEADPNGLQRSVRAGIAEGLGGKALCDFLFQNGHGANSGAKPFDNSVAGRLVKAIAHLDGA
jgi:hypothetical protein